MRFKSAALIFVTIVFSGCSTTGNSYKEEKITDIKSLESRYEYYQNENKLFSMLQLVIQEEKKDNIDKNIIIEKKKEIIQLIKNKYKQDLEELKYMDALDIVNSIETAELTDQFEIDSEKGMLWEKYLLQEIDQGNLNTAMYGFIKYSGTSEKTDIELLKNIAEIAYQSSNRYILEKAVEKYSELKIDADIKYNEFLQKKHNPSEMIEGTVTIWVNKGIKVQSGVGTPDRAIGSGFYIDKRGYIITNYHVIESEVNPEYEGYSRLFIRKSDSVGTKIPAKVVGWDPVFDIALLKTEILPEYVFAINAETKYRPGDSIFAIGSPGGLDRTITSGIVSATGRRFLQLGDSMQVDVPINPGNSGGPLLNDKGELIGIVFAGIEQFEGINFAIPSHWVIDFLPDLYKGGEISHSWLGMSVYEKQNRIEIVYTVPGEPASLAGLRNGDILKSINGQDSKNIIQIQKQLLSYNSDRLVKVVYERENTEYEALIALGKRPVKAFDLALKRDSMKNVILPLFGMELESTGNYLFKEGYSIRKIIEGSVAYETGLSVNDPLTIKTWKYDFKKRYVLLTIVVKKRKAGFMESGVQLVTSLDSNNLL